MPSPVAAWTGNTFPTAKSLNLALSSSDGTADNPTGTAFLAYRPAFLESCTTAASFTGASGGSTSTLSTSGSVTTCAVVLDSAGYYGQTSDLPGRGYYQFTSVIEGAAGDGVTPGGWMVLSHFAPVQPTGTQTAVGAGLVNIGGSAYTGSAQLPAGGTNVSCPFFADLLNVGTTAWQPQLSLYDSAGSKATLAVNATDASGQTPRFYAVWSAVTASTQGQVSFTSNGTYSWTAPPGVTSVTVTGFGAGGGGGAGDASAGGIGYGGGGGGGGEYASASVAVTAGNNYTPIVGAGGAGGTQPGGGGSNGGNSSFAGDAATVTAHGGSAGSGATTSADGAGGAGGTGSSATTHHNGGAGATGSTGTYGGGAGSSAGTKVAGITATSGSGAPAPPGGGPGGAGGQQAITIVQSGGGTQTGSNNLVITFGSPLQAENTVVVCTTLQSTTVSSDPTVTLSDGTKLDSAQDSIYTGGNPSIAVAIFYAAGVAGGETGVTVTFGSGSDAVTEAQFYEVAGLGASPATDASNGATGHANTSYSVQATTTGTPDIWFGMTGAGSSPNSFSVNAASGWTNLPQESASRSGFNCRMRSGYQIGQPPGTMKYSGTFSSKCNNASVVAAFTSGATTAGTSPLVPPGGGGGGGLGLNNGGPGDDGSITLAWTGATGSGYGTPPLPTPFAAWEPATTVGTSGLQQVNINGPSGITQVVNYLCNPPIARVATTSGQSIPNSTLTAYSAVGGGLTVDNYGGLIFATYTVQRSGLYLFHGVGAFAANSTGVRLAGATVNGTTYWGPAYAATAAGETYCTKTQIFSLQAGDTVTLSFWQNSGGSLSLSNAAATRMFLTWLGTGGVPVQPWSPPDTTFRWKSGTGPGDLPGQLQTHLANDLNFLVNPPYLLSYQTVAQTGLTVGSFSTATMDTLGGIVHSDTGDNYSGWTAGASNLYTAPCGGWWLCCAEYFTASSAASHAQAVAGLALVTSGGRAPSVTPDFYQANAVTGTASAGGGATVLGLIYLAAGETVQPQLMGQSFAAAYSTLEGAQNSGQFNSSFALVWVSR